MHNLDLKVAAAMIAQRNRIIHAEKTHCFVARYINDGRFVGVTGNRVKSKSRALKMYNADYFTEFFGDRVEVIAVKIRNR